jgi:hypothetical protein
MTEQAMSQLLYKDFEGAAGNMFSLHTDFFKKSYAPDSYVIRSVGYLNLCQYADAHKVVQDLVRKYKPILAGLDAYAKKTQNDYDTIREFAKNPTANEIKGLARPLLFALAQDPTFDRHQERINQVEDELTHFKDLNLEIVKQERELAAKISEIGTEIAKGAKKESAQAIESLQVSLEKIKFEHKQMTVARKALQTQRGPYFDSMEKIKDERKVLASAALVERRKALAANLKMTLDQADVLLYEIYNGAGDHLRFEAAGGKVEGRTTAALKGTKENDQKWKFQGEVWEDELGHFRSSLTNVCAQEKEGA